MPPQAHMYVAVILTEGGIDRKILLLAGQLVLLNSVFSERLFPKKKNKVRSDWGRQPASTACARTHTLESTHS